jgi:hypothetical protein
VRQLRPLPAAYFPQEGYSASFPGDLIPRLSTRPAGGSPRRTWRGETPYPPLNNPARACRIRTRERRLQFSPARRRPGTPIVDAGNPPAFPFPPPPAAKILAPVADPECAGPGVPRSSAARGFRSLCHRAEAHFQSGFEQPAR